MTTDNIEAPSGFDKFNDYADMNRGAFLNATAPAAYTAIQQRFDGAMAYTAGTELAAQIGQVFKMDGNEAVPTGETFDGANTEQTAAMDVKLEPYTPA